MKNKKNKLKTISKKGNNTHKITIENLTNLESDYVLEDFINLKNIVKKPINDESADIFGNFNEQSIKDKLLRKEIDLNPNDLDDRKRDDDYLKTNPEDDIDSDVEVDDAEEDEDVEVDDDEDVEEEENVVKEININNSLDANNKDCNGNLKANKPLKRKQETVLTSETNSLKKQKNEIKSNKPTSDLSKEQIQQLLYGAKKSNRFVLYVTNLSYETSKTSIEEYFSNVCSVKSVRVPKQRKGGYVFVEMHDVDSLQRAMSLHNTLIDGRQIKIQISEGGKKKSANKKNILKQKNRKLAEMRNEDKRFTKSGKFFQHTKTAKNRLKARAQNNGKK